MSNPNWKNGRQKYRNSSFLEDEETAMTLEQYNRQRAKETTECPKQGKTEPPRRSRRS